MTRAIVASLVVVVLSACAAGAARSAYERNLAECDLAPTCEAVLLCRARASEAAGRSFHGYCISDGGTE